MTQGAGEDGFTLIEMVVCLGVLALIASFTASGLALVRRGGVLVEALDRDDAGRAVQAHLRRGVESATPVFVERDGTAELLFKGAPDRLSLVTRSDRRLEGGGLVLATFAVDGPPGATALVTDRRPVSARGNGPAAALRRVLLERIRAVRFRYYGSLEPGVPGTWSANWASPNRLPALIEVSLDPQPGTGRAWPRMLLAVPAGQ